MIKVLELQGQKAMNALNMFSALMLGLKMLPMYAAEDYHAFLDRIQQMPEVDQENMIREAAMFVSIEKDELEGALSFTCDANGIAIGPENIKNLGLSDIFERTVAVAMAVSRIKIRFITQAEKKKSQASQ